ncbi:MAG: serine/threonine-protein kinase [Lachnospiraceae bacterium]|nr:serine/threonine protein kinase [Lachnospiraceae bacterium]MDD7379195.1 serine/threonine-protein kinase [Lachnospiraceae bacterium]MDY4616695.1 serine/threonine-protein kinase [Lachnospiraceae bacterium]
MTIEEEYRLSQYEDLGTLNNRENIRLKRHKIYGQICVEKRVEGSLKYIYDFIMQNPTPYIPHIYENILDGNCLIIVEEYIQGRNLEEILRQQRIEENEAVRILLQLCEALKVLHHAKPTIVCRDLKAENVMIDCVGEVKIVDFDIARIYQDGKRRDTNLLGTAEYAAPEQYGYFQTDNRTDIYALGILFNYMLTGQFPVERMAEGRPLKIIKKCTYLNPKERYQSVEELQRDIRKFYPMRDSEKEQETKDDVKNSWLPPGFRTKTPWKVVSATFGYLMITYLCFSLTIQSEGKSIVGPELYIERTLAWLSQIAFIALACNYRGVGDWIKITKVQNRILRIILYVISYFVLMIFAVLIAEILEMIFL